MVAVGISIGVLLQRGAVSSSSNSSSSSPSSSSSSSNHSRTHRSNSAAAAAAEKQGYALADVVAGHSISQLEKESTKDDPVALVRDGLFLKPVQSDVRGRREVSFYESPSNTASDSIPHYNGCEIIGGTSYLRLNDVEKNFIHPCTIDIKVGRQTWAPGATPAKMERARKKWKNMQQTATAVCGMKVYRPVTSSYLRLGKKYGRSLGKNGMLHALTSFLHNGHVVRVDVIANLIRLLAERRSWLEKTCKYVCYSMSVLLVYDGDDGSTVNKGEEERPRVVFVDFAHSFLNDTTTDDGEHAQQKLGCLAGIDHVIESLIMIRSLYEEEKVED